MKAVVFWESILGNSRNPNRLDTGQIITTPESPFFKKGIEENNISSNLSISTNLSSTDLRTWITPDDKEGISQVLKSTHFFSPSQIEMVECMVEETIELGERVTGYHWILAQNKNGILGFACFGKDPFSTHSCNLYWICIHEKYRNQGIGSILLNQTEWFCQKMEFSILWLETSGRALYEPTRYFYHKKGFNKIAELKDFYEPGNSKIIYQKEIPPGKNGNIS